MCIHFKVRLSSPPVVVHIFYSRDHRSRVLTSHFLCNRKQGLKSPVSDWRLKMAMLCSSTRASSTQEFPVMISNWTRQSQKLIFSIQLVIRINASEMLKRPDAHSYECHTHTTRHATRPHTTTSATLAWLLSLLLLDSGQRDTLSSTPVSSTYEPDGRSVRYR